MNSSIVAVCTVTWFSPWKIVQPTKRWNLLCREFLKNQKLGNGQKKMKLIFKEKQKLKKKKGTTSLNTQLSSGLNIPATSSGINVA